MASHFSREFFQMLNQYLYEKFEVMKEDDEDDEEECEECGSTLCKKEIVSGMRKNIKRLGL
jgi:predicted nucleic acid-binding Zn ribbon protein